MRPPLFSIRARSSRLSPTSKRFASIIRRAAYDPKPEAAKQFEPKPLIRHYDTVPAHIIDRPSPPPPPRDPSTPPIIRKTGLRTGNPEGRLTRKIWVSPHIPPNMTAPGHQGHLDTRVAANNQAPATVSTRPKNNLTIEGHILSRPDITTPYVDTHAHLITTLQMLKDELHDETIPQDAINTLVERLFPKEVVAVVDIHCDLPLNNYHEKATALDWPDHFKYYFAIGVHPHCAMSYTDEVHESLVKAVSHPSCVAWGECGLDYLKNPVETHSTQQAVFARQLSAAVALGKPIVVHTREADEDTLKVIRENVPKDHRMHIHCFTAGPNLARAILGEYPNSYIGITGVISYRGLDHVTEMISEGVIPLERILLETDSPYMVPREVYYWIGKERPKDKKKKFVISHSGMIPFTAGKIVEAVNTGRKERGTGEPEVTLAEVLEITRKNASKMYGISV